MRLESSVVARADEHVVSGSLFSTMRCIAMAAQESGCLTFFVVEFWRVISIKTGSNSP